MNYFQILLAILEYIIILYFNYMSFGESLLIYPLITVYDLLCFFIIFKVDRLSILILNYTIR